MLVSDGLLAHLLILPLTLMLRLATSEHAPSESIGYAVFVGYTYISRLFDENR